jgi:hypothetical protein
MAEIPQRHHSLHHSAAIQSRPCRFSSFSTAPPSPQSKQDSSPLKKTDDVTLSHGLASAIEQLKNEIISEKKALLALKQELAAKQEELEKARHHLQNLYSNAQDIIVLNVGGKEYHTSRSTLTKDANSMLCRMFTGALPSTKDALGRYFIDRNGDLFRYILDYLRDSNPEIIPNDANLMLALLREAQFFQLEGLIHYLKERQYPYSTNGWIRFDFLRGRVLKDEDWELFRDYVTRGADLKVGNPRDKSGIIDISRLVVFPDHNYMNVHCLREHRGGDRTGYKILSLHVTQQTDKNGIYYLSDAIPVNNLATFFGDIMPENGLSNLSERMDFTLFVKPANWHIVGTYGNGIPLTPNKFSKIRALAKSGASFKVSCHMHHGSESGHSCAYTTIIPVCRVIPHVTESTMWFYAKREHDTGERTLGIFCSLRSSFS